LRGGKRSLRRNECQAPTAQRYWRGKLAKLTISEKEEILEVAVDREPGKRMGNNRTICWHERPRVSASRLEERREKRGRQKDKTQGNGQCELKTGVKEKGGGERKKAGGKFWSPLEFMEGQGTNCFRIGAEGSLLYPRRRKGGGID